jgi:hypothetical protein
MILFFISSWKRLCIPIVAIIKTQKVKIKQVKEEKIGKK